MNLIFEGCDRVGKTTTINELMKRSPNFYELRKCSHPPIDMPWREQNLIAKEEYLHGIKDLNTHNNIIYDRFILGEAVYAPLMRGYYPNYIRHAEKMIKKDNNLLILLTAGSKEIAKRFDYKYINLSFVPAILKMFEEQFKNTNFHYKICIDTTHTQTSKVCDEIENAVELISQNKWFGIGE